MTRMHILRTAAVAAALTATLAASAQNQSQDNMQKDRDQQQERDQQQQLDLHRTSRILGMRVETQDGERVGKIENLALNPNNGRVVYAIVDTQGMEQSRGQFKAVPFKALRIRDIQQPAQLNVDMQRFRDAPPFDPDGWNTISNPQWKRTVFQHYGLSVDDEQRQQQQGGGQDESANLIRITEVMEMDVNNRDRQALGEVDELMIDTRRAQVVFAVLSPADRVDAQGQHIVVAWPALNWRPQADALVLDLDRNQFRNAPTVQRESELANPRFVQRVYTFYGEQPDFVYGYTPPGGGQGAGGWEHRSEYGRMFDASTVETVEGEMQAIERFTPMSGMADGVMLRLRANQGQTTQVHLGPAWYVERQNLLFNQGDQVRITGSRTQVDGQNVIIATEIRSGDRILFLRDQNGLPRWDAAYRISEVQQQRQQQPQRGRDAEDFPPGSGLPRDKDN